MDDSYDLKGASTAATRPRFRLNDRTGGDQLAERRVELLAAEHQPLPVVDPLEVVGEADALAAPGRASRTYSLISR